MDEAWIGVIGALVGGAASIAATWLTLRHSKRDNEESMRTIVIRGAAILHSNVLHAIEAWRLYTANKNPLSNGPRVLNNGSVSQIATAVSAIRDPLPETLPVSSRKFSQHIRSFAKASNDVHTLKLHFSPDNMSAANGGNIRLVLEYFPLELISGHLKAMADLARSFKQLRVVPYWTADDIQALYNALDSSGIDARFYTDEIGELRGAVQ